MCTNNFRNLVLAKYFLIVFVIRSNSFIYLCTLRTLDWKLFVTNDNMRKQITYFRFCNPWPITFSILLKDARFRFIFYTNFIDLDYFALYDNVLNHIFKFETILFGNIEVKRNTTRSLSISWTLSGEWC